MLHPLTSLISFCFLLFILPPSSQLIPIEVTSDSGTSTNCPPDQLHFRLSAPLSSAFFDVYRGFLCRGIYALAIYLMLLANDAWGVLEAVLSLSSVVAASHHSQITWRSFRPTLGLVWKISEIANRFLCI